MMATSHAPLHSVAELAHIRIGEEEEVRNF
jgi:hypothetical protein